MTRYAAAGAKSLHVAAGGGHQLLSAGYTKCILASTITLHTRNACAVSVVTAVSRQGGGLDAARSDFQRFQGSLLIMGFCGAFGNTALGRPRSVEDLWGFGFPARPGGCLAHRSEGWKGEAV